MDWLDWVLLLAVGAAAIRGFFRGFVVEVCTLLAWMLGIWAAIHLSGRVGAWAGLGADRQMLAFGITFLIVLVGVHFLARAITKAIDLAQLSLPNKVMGVVFGAVRSAFVLSVVLNVLHASPAASGKLDEASEGSALYGPVRSFAPLIIPALKQTKWVDRLMDDVQKEMDKATE
jgi:membrane protein required for colicin V production